LEVRRERETDPEPSIAPSILRPTRPLREISWEPVRALVDAVVRSSLLVVRLCVNTEKDRR
jgi:hypothetical protein